MEERDDTVYLHSKINEIFATTESIQYFTNILNNPIELTIYIPIIEEITLMKFVISINEKIIISKVLSKEKAKEKYTDAISSGNEGFFSEYENNYNFYTVNIGNIKPKEKVQLNTYFIQMLGSKDMSYEFIIMQNYPLFYHKNENKGRNKIINANFEIQTQSKITRLIAPFLNAKSKKNSIYEVEYNPDYKFAKIIYRYYPNKSNKTFLLNFSILFRTENMNKPVLYTQYNPELKETSYIINYIYTSKNLKEIPVPEKPDEDNNISYYNKYEEIINNETPGLFIFLIDQSGSMDGRPINIVKKALLLFIQSLPNNSYFQLIGFGSHYKKYNMNPLTYNKENVSKIINIINKLNADLGLTNISRPLENIFMDKSYSNLNLSKNIFLLTDGKVNDREKCFNLIENNSDKFRIHSLGIGKDFDEILIEKCGKLGKGTSSFVKNIENINSVIIDILNKSLRPYITQLKFNFENYKKEISSNIITCKPKDDFLYQNEIINYSFILSGNKNLSDLKIKITGKNPLNEIEEEVNKNFKIEDGEEMSKMIIGKALKNNEELIKNEKKEIEFAKKYQILSKNTAIFAEILNEEKLQNKLIQIKINSLIPKEEKKHNTSFLCKKRKLNIPCRYLYHKFSCRLYRHHNLSTNNFNNSIERKKSISKYKRIFKSKARKISKEKIDLDSFENEKYLKKEFRLREKEEINLDEEKNKSHKHPKKDNINLIMTQDIIEGFWDENKETEKIINIISLNKVNKIRNKIKEINKGENMNKIIYTILVIYYLKSKCKNQLKEYRLVINKAIKFLQKNNIDYDDIASHI